LCLSYIYVPSLSKSCKKKDCDVGDNDDTCAKQQKLNITRESHIERLRIGQLDGFVRDSFNTFVEFHNTRCEKRYHVKPILLGPR